MPSPPILHRMVAATLLLSPAMPLTATTGPASKLPDETVGLPVFEEASPPATSPRSPRQVEGWADRAPDDTPDSTQAESSHRADRNGGPGRNDTDSSPRRLDRKDNATEEQDTAQDPQQPVTIRYVVKPGDNLWDITHAVLVDDRGEPSPAASMPPTGPECATK